MAAEQLDPLWHVLKGYLRIRSYDPHLLVEALGLLREMYAANKRTLLDTLPLTFLRQKWTPHVLRDGQIDRKAYELAV